MKIPLCFHALSAQSSFNDSSGGIFLKSLLRTRNQLLLVLKIYGKANFLKMLTHVDQSNLRPVLLQTSNTSHSYRFHKSRVPLFRCSTDSFKNHPTIAQSSFIFSLKHSLNVVTFSVLDKECRFHFQLSFNYVILCLLYF